MLYILPCIIVSLFMPLLNKPLHTPHTSSSCGISFTPKKGIYMYPLSCDNIFQEVKIQHLRTNSQILVLFLLLPAALEAKLPSRASEATWLGWLLCFLYFPRRIQMFFSMDAVPCLATDIGSGIMLVIVLLLFLEQLKEPLLLLCQRRNVRRYPRCE